MRDWEDRQSLVSVALLVAALFGYGAIADDPLWSSIGVAVAAVYLAVRFFVMTPMAMWNDAQGKLIDFHDRLEPRLTLVFDPDRPPFLQELYVQPKNSAPIYERRYRVGVRNDSSVVVRNVRVVLESFEMPHQDGAIPLTPNQAVFIEHALNVMGRDNKNGLVDVAPGDTPTAFIDVVVQDIDPTTQKGDYMSPAYASKLWSDLFSRGTYILGLRVEGGGYSSRAKFIVDATIEDRRIKMRPYALL